MARKVIMRKGRPLLRPRNGGQWTEARWRAFVISALRSATIRWGPRYAVIKNAFVARGDNPETGRPCKLHLCAMCQGTFPQSHMRADHILPVVDPSVGFVSWDEYINRMFCEASGFQALCLRCHEEKSRRESLVRRGKGHQIAVRKRR